MYFRSRIETLLADLREASRYKAYVLHRIYNAALLPKLSETMPEAKNMLNQWGGEDRAV